MNLFTPIDFVNTNHGYEPQGEPWTLIPPQGAGYYTFRLRRDCSTINFNSLCF